MLVYGLCAGKYKELKPRTSALKTVQYSSLTSQRFNRYDNTWLFNSYSEELCATATHGAQGIVPEIRDLVLAQGGHGPQKVVWHQAPLAGRHFVRGHVQAFVHLPVIE
jgi:hypothetical protein